MDIYYYVDKITGSIFFWTYLSTIICHILSFYTIEFNGSKTFFNKIIPNKSNTFYERLDFVFLPLIGAIICKVIFQPETIKFAMVSGLSWTTAIDLLKKNTYNQNKIEKK